MYSYIFPRKLYGRPSGRPPAARRRISADARTGARPPFWFCFIIMHTWCDLSSDRFISSSSNSYNSLTTTQTTLPYNTPYSYYSPLQLL